MPQTPKPQQDHSSTHAFKGEIWDLRWVREPQQDRSAKTKARLLDATVELLEHEGVDGLTIAKIAHTANCSVGSFYHHFQDKQAVIYAVLDRFSRETWLTAQEGLLPERWAGVSLMELLEGYVRFSLKIGKQYPGVSHARRRLIMEDANIAQRSENARAEVRQMIIKLLRLRSAEVNHPNQQLALALVLDMLGAMLERRAVVQSSTTQIKAPRQSEESFVRELMYMASTYLGIQP